ncbi:hypothetical protein C2E23DRAFT_867363 [Lenzites betulinus]|nr:hypothetical protein C2E23DRAFT_867363 [Lenzites betulinus]
MSHRPHPILKRDSSPFRTPTLPFSTCGPTFSPHVHFPPTPRLVAETFPAYSPTTYDRAPIAVSPNVCQIPRRGERTVRSPAADFEGDCRGRSRTRGKRSENVKGSYFHPRAYEACKPEPVHSTAYSLPATPPLVDDLSPSDESDSTVTTPPDPNVSAAIASCPMPLQLPGAPPSRAPRRMPPLDKGDVGSPPPAMRSPLGPNSGRRARRPNLVRKETRLGQRTVSFSPDTDEGCLGGF